MERVEGEKIRSFQQLVSSELEELEIALEKALRCDTPLLRDVCSYIREGKGKRIRPTVLFLAARSAGNPDGELIPAGVAVELIHTATLIHDDILDEHMMRRGRPSVYARWGSKTATIVGDFLYTRAFTILATLKLYELMKILAEVSNTICIGEILQLEQRRNLHMSEEGYIDVITKKTASLFSAACECGAIIGGEKNGNRKIFSRFGENIGVAFQITDDLYDYLGDEEKIGKPVGSDFSDGRITLPFIKAYGNAPNNVRERMIELLEVEFDRASWPEIVSFVQNYGGVEYSIRRARDFGEKAKFYLLSIAPSIERDALEMAADYIIDRVLSI